MYQKLLTDKLEWGILTVLNKTNVKYITKGAEYYVLWICAYQSKDTEY